MFLIFVTVYYKDLRRLVDARGPTPVKRLGYVRGFMHIYISILIIGLNAYLHIAIQ